jgi:aldose sugar dehydrogenase
MSIMRRVPWLAAAALLAGCGAAGDAPPGGTDRPGSAADGAAQPATSSPPSAEDRARVAHRVVTVVEGLEHPWGLAFLPDGEGMLVTERPGRLRLVRQGQLVAEPIAGVPAVRASGQGGLLDVTLHPDFARNRLVYLSYSKPGDRGATTAVARGRLDGVALVGVEDIFVADAWASGGQHFGSRLVFDGAGHLYITVGDRGDGQRAQNLRDHAGTTLRLHDDGRVPQDNPFVGRTDARPEIYTFGNRNAQGMVLHPATGEVWLNEHGPRGGDEINRVVAGRNYGWPEFSFGNHYTGRRIPDPTADAGLELPLLHWTPSIAPSGMAVYTGDVFPQWRGDVFVGALAGQHLRRVRFDGTRVVEQEELLRDRRHRIRDVRNGPDGLIYLLVDDSRAPLLRLEPAVGG